jgi:DNA polymerase eta
VPLPRLEAVVGEQDALWLSRLAQGQDGEEVKPRTLPKSLSCGKSFRGANALTSVTAVHQWLLELAQELQQRVIADRTAHARLPRLLTVSIDHMTEPAAATAAAAAASAVAVNAAANKLAATAVAAAAAAAAAGGEGGDGGGADATASAAGEAAACPPSSTAAAAAEAAAGAVRNWRAGISSVSRSCTLRHATADVVAADALALVKKWARSRWVL